MKKYEYPDEQNAAKRAKQEVKMAKTSALIECILSMTQLSYHKG